MCQAFERRYVSNLPSRADRRRETSADIVRIGAIAEFHGAQEPYASGKLSSIVEHRANHSHLAVWTRLIGCESGLVMEDDVAFERDITRGAELVTALPADGEIYYLGHMQYPRAPRYINENGLLQISDEVEFMGLYHYAVNGRDLRPLLDAHRSLGRDLGNPDGGPMSIAGALSIAHRQNPFVTCAMMPPISYQRASYTDFGVLRWFDRITAVAGMMNVARRVQDQARRT